MKESTKDKYMVLGYFLTEQDNTAMNIANKFGFSVFKVDRIINNHLKSKKPGFEK